MALKAEIRRPRPVLNKNFRVCCGWHPRRPSRRLSPEVCLKTEDSSWHPPKHTHTQRRQCTLLFFGPLPFHVGPCHACWHRILFEASCLSHCHYLVNCGMFTPLPKQVYTSVFPPQLPISKARKILHQQVSNILANPWAMLTSNTSANLIGHNFIDTLFATSLAIFVCQFAPQNHTADISRHWFAPQGNCRAPGPPPASAGTHPGQRPPSPWLRRQTPSPASRNFRVLPKPLRAR